MAGRGSSDARPPGMGMDGHGFNPHVRQHSFIETGHEIIATAIVFHWFKKGSCQLHSKYW